MTRSDRGFLSASALAAGAAFAHAARGGHDAELPCYFPTERLWRLASPNEPLSMCWYAATAESWAAGLLLAAAVWIGTGFLRGAPDPLTIRAAGWNAVLFALGAMALYLFVLRPWQ